MIYVQGEASSRREHQLETRKLAVSSFMVGNT